MKLKWFIIMILLVPATLLQSLGEDNGRDYICYPGHYDFGKLNFTAGFTIAYLPEKIVEEEINTLPMIDMNLRLGLPYGFSFYGRASSVYITNQFTAGLLWSCKLNNLAFSFGDDIAYWFGKFGYEGFDVATKGWMNYPYISAGYDFGHFYFTVKAELIILTSLKDEIGGTIVNDISNNVSGIAFSFIVEQPFWNDQHVMAGLKISDTKFFYQSWLSYETFDTYMTFPEFVFGFIF